MVIFTMRTNMVLCSIFFGLAALLVVLHTRTQSQMNPQVCLFVCYSGLCAHYCINPSFPSLVAQWRGGKIEICNYPSVYGCDMQLYCFWFAVVVGYSGVPPRRQCFWLIGMLEKDGCQRLCVLFEALLFEVFPFVDKSNQEGHRNILAKCLASCLTKEKKNARKQNILVSMC